MRTLITAGIAAVGITAVFALPTIAITSTSNAERPSATVAGAPNIGDLVDYKFSSPPMNSGGLSNLADLRGRPLMIEFWGTR